LASEKSLEYGEYSDEVSVGLPAAATLNSVVKGRPLAKQTYARVSGDDVALDEADTKVHQWPPTGHPLLMSYGRQHFQEWMSSRASKGQDIFNEEVVGPDSKEKYGKPPPLHLCSQQRADRYIADPRDPIDVEVAETLKPLSVDARQKLELRRLIPGKYIIDSRPCEIYRKSTINDRGLWVHEAEVCGEDVIDMPLGQYLHVAASVAVQLQSGKDSCRKQAATFVQEDCDTDEGKMTAMKLACVQAGVWHGDTPPPLNPVVPAYHIRSYT
jgi:hypothetical protein